MILPIVICILGGPLRLEAKWTAPAQLPFERVHSVVRAGGDFYIAGIKGLAKGQPGKWKQLDERPVKQIVRDHYSLWVLFGDGSLDKIEYSKDRLIFDTLLGKVKRPWASSIAKAGVGVLVGGQGGWFHLEESGFTETYPKELEKEVVTAICESGGWTWIGTQKSGIWRYAKGELKRFGFAAGLSDSWVTAVMGSPKSLIVGLADGGLVRQINGRFEPTSCPIQKVRNLAVFDDRLVVGGMEGAWVETSTGWQKLTDEETTFLGAVEDKLAVGTPTGLAWWQK